MTDDAHRGRTGDRGPQATGERTKALIAEIARERFGAEGYAQVSLRAIAAQAEVDPALVIHYFRSKENLFLETLPTFPSLTHVLDGPPAELGRRLVARLLSPEAAVGLRSFGALVRASDSPTVRARLRELLTAGFTEALEPHVQGDDAPLRIRLVGASLAGLLVASAAAGSAVSDSVSDVDHAAVVALYGDAVQTLVDGAQAGGAEG